MSDLIDSDDILQNMPKNGFTTYYKVPTNHKHFDDESPIFTQANSAFNWGHENVTKPHS